MAYAEGLEAGPLDQDKVLIAQQLLDGLYDSDAPPWIAAQVFAELFHLLSRKSALSRSEIAERLSRVRVLSRFIATDEAVIDAAIVLAAEHRLQIYDAIILAAAYEAQCDVLLSEDLQHGFTWRGVRVKNPFADTAPNLKAE